MIQVHVLGAGQDVGRSCFLVHVGIHRIILDCGAHHGFEDDRRFPAFETISPGVLSSVDAVLISHFHFDHIGALPLLSACHDCRAPVYMTVPTRDLGRLVLLDIVTTSRARGQHCPFSELDVYATLDATTLVHVNQKWSLPNAPGICVTAFPAGHCIGAVMFLISFPDGSSVLYSGDYALRSDRYVPTAAVPFGLAPTLFITEATYSNAARSPSRLAQEKKLVTSVTDALRCGGKILIPVPALGSIQAIVALLSLSRNLPTLQAVPIYVTAGLSTRGNTIYAVHDEWSCETSCVHCPPHCLVNKTNKRKRSRFADPCPHNIMSKLRSFNRNDHWDSVVLAPGPVILFTTPGSLATGLSRDVFQSWGNDPNNLVIVPSSKFSVSVAADFAKNSDSAHFDNLTAQFSSPSACCKLVNLPSHSHPDRRDIIRMCAHVNPENLMLVHGERTKIVKFQQDIQSFLSVKCYAPSNGEIVNIRSTREEPRACGSIRQSDGSTEVDEWDTLQSQYRELMIKLRPTQSLY